jgi:hypothetical protein
MNIPNFIRNKGMFLVSFGKSFFPSERKKSGIKNGKKNG